MMPKRPSSVRITRSRKAIPTARISFIINLALADSLRRLGGRGGALGGGAALHESHRPDRAFIKRDQRQSERHLAQHVRRGEHRGDDEGNDDEVAALRLELLGSDDANAAEQRQNHGKLKRHAESEDQLHHQRQIILDLGQKLDRRLAWPAQLLHAEANKASLSCTTKYSRSPV